MARTSKNDPLAVDAYLATLPKAERDTLEQLRTLIKETVPQVEERISYGTAVMFSLGQRPRGIRVAAKTSVVLHGKPEAGRGDEGRDHEDALGQRRHDSFLN